MKNLLVIIAILSLFFSCAKENKTKDPLYYSNDLENTIGWNDHASLTVGDDAHSGKVFSKTTAEFPYSYGFHRTLKDISEKRVKKAEFSAWVNTSTANSKGNLVLAIDTANNNIFWVGTDLKTLNVTPGKWFQVKGKATLPLNISKSADLKVYFWNTGKDAVLVDDFEITFKDL